MIFFDETGRRWNRIKHSTFGLVVISGVPVLALLLGSLAYHPQWGALPLIQKTAGAVLSAANNPITSAAQAAHKPAANATPKPTAKPVRSAVTVKPTAAPSPAVLSAGTTAQATPAPAQPTATPKPDPTQNDFGRSHQPIR